MLQWLRTSSISTTGLRCRPLCIVGRWKVQVSAKYIIWLTLAIFVVLVLLQTNYLSNSLWSNAKRPLRNELGTTSRKLFERRGKIVLLFSNQRSGSTFLGEFFNKNPSVFYLFEPLFSFSLSCTLKYEERLQTLMDMASCNFRDVPRAYKDAHDANQYNDVAGKCLTDNVCFYQNQDRIMESYSPVCRRVNEGKLVLKPYSDVNFSLRDVQHEKFDKKSSTCGLPFNMTLVSALCSTSDFVAYKVLRVCDLEKLQSVYQRLRDLANDVYVIHLVRDPRAILHSSLNAELQPDGVEKKSIRLCGRVQTNLQYVEDKLSAEPAKNELISDGRYFRIRYEDITEDPMRAARDIYKFIGAELPLVVENWLKDSTDPDARMQEYHDMLESKKMAAEDQAKILKKLEVLVQQRKSNYGTVRDTKSVAWKWRKSMDIKHINLVQKHCRIMMERLGYKFVHDIHEVRDMSLKLW